MILSDAFSRFWRVLSFTAFFAAMGVLGSLPASAAEPSGKLMLATCQFPVSADIEANGRWIRKQMREAASQGAELIHFSECALSGYAGAEHKTLDNLDWDSLRRETESILTLARELGVWVVLGSTHRLENGDKPHNSLYLISPEGKVVDRYDKRFCTEGDLKWYSPGDHLVTFEVNGVRCGLLICYDIRFPELYRQYELRDVRLMLHSFHNAGSKKETIHPKIMPVTAQARAATNGMFVSINNSSAPRSWQSRFITPDGLVAAELSLDQPGVMVNLVDTTREYYDAAKPFRRDTIQGKLHSGETVDNPRSADRTSF